jgi:hypothetical protein
MNKSKMRAAMKESMHRVTTAAETKMGLASSSFVVLGAEAVFDGDVTEYSFSRQILRSYIICSSGILHNP